MSKKRNKIDATSKITTKISNRLRRKKTAFIFFDTKKLQDKQKMEQKE